MSFNTPILTVLSWAKAGAASPNPASATSAAVRRASIFFFIEFLQRLNPGGSLFGASPGPPLVRPAPRGNAPIVARPRSRHDADPMELAGAHAGARKLRSV